MYEPAVMGKKKFYAVRTGRKTGVYCSWEECQAQVNGYSGAVYKGFATRQEAVSFAKCGSHGTQKPSGSSSARRTYSGDFASTSREECQAQVNGYSGAVYKGFATRQEAVSFAKCGSHGTQKPSGSSSARRTYSGDFACTSRSKSKSKRSKRQCSGGSSSGSSRKRKLPVAYSNGSCFGNGYRVALGGVGVYWGKNHPYNVSEKLMGHQTLPRAQLVSACRALETAIDQGHKAIQLKTDSNYAIKSMTEWVQRWKINGWKTSCKEDVKNREDIQKLDRLCQQVNVNWMHVPVDSSVPGNVAAESLAKAGSSK